MAVITETPPPPASVNLAFLSRVAGLPVVNLAFDCASSVYMKAKEGSPFLVQKTLSTAEQTVKLAVDRALPIVNKLEKPISVVDILACRTLDKVETSLPIVTKTPEEISAATQTFVNEKLLVPAAKTADKVLDNALGQLALGMLSYAITTTDNYVDSYLPGKTKAVEEEEASTETVSESPVGNQPSQQVTYSVRRAAGVASKVHQRVAERARLVLDDVEVLGHAYAHTLLSLIEWARLHSKDAQSIGLVSKLQDLGTEFRQQLEAKQPVSESVKLVSGLTERLTHVLSFATEVMGGIPSEAAAGIRDRIEAGLNFVTDTGAQLAMSTKMDEAALSSLVVLQQRLPFIYSSLVDASAVAVGFSKLAFPNWNFNLENITSEVNRRSGVILAEEENPKTENEEKPLPVIEEPQPSEMEPVETPEKLETSEEVESPEIQSPEIESPEKESPDSDVESF